MCPELFVPVSSINVNLLETIVVVLTLTVTWTKDFVPLPQDISGVVTEVWSTPALSLVSVSAAFAVCSPRDLRAPFCLYDWSHIKIIKILSACSGFRVKLTCWHTLAASILIPIWIILATVFAIRRYLPTAFHTKLTHWRTSTSAVCGFICFMLATLFVGNCYRIKAETYYLCNRTAALH
jgi:hypothetical protein